MSNTVEFAVKSMCFLPYTHIIVRRRGSAGIEPLGGGDLSKVLSRYGSMIVERSFVVDDTLYIDVEGSESIPESRINTGDLTQ